MDQLKDIQSDLDLLGIRINNHSFSIDDLWKEIQELKSRVVALEEKGLGY